MAYVPLTDANRSAIRAVLMGLQRKEEATLGDETVLVNKITEYEPLRTVVVEALWGDYIDLFDRLDTLSRTANVPVSWEYAINHTDGTQTFHDERVVITDIRIPVVVKMDGWGNINSSLTKLKGHQIFSDPIFMELRNLRQVQYECSDRWEAVIRQVTGFLDKCKSLNEAVKLWPDLRRYVPADLQRRLDLKPEREKTDASSAAEALKAIDMDAVNTSTVLARMAGGDL